MPLSKFKKNINLIFILFVSLTLYHEVSLNPADAGTPHMIYGDVVDAEGNIPSDGSVNFKVYVSERPGEILTESDTGCGYEDGWVEIGNFPSPWSVGEELNISTDDGTIEDIVISKSGGQELSLTVTADSGTENKSDDNDGGGAGDTNCFISTMTDEVRLEKTSAGKVTWVLFGILFAGCLFVKNALSKKGHFTVICGISSRLVFGIIFFQSVFIMGTDGKLTAAIAETVTFELKAGWNGISVPFEDAGITTAEDLIAAVPGCDGVRYWDAAQQKYVEHQKGAETDNFAVVSGNPYFVHVTRNTDWSLSGEVLTDADFRPATTQTTNINAFAVPLDRTDLTDAEALANDIPNCDVVWYWNPTNGGYVGHPKGSSINNFSIKPGYAYLINIPSNISIIYPANGAFIDTHTPTIQISFGGGADVSGFQVDVNGGNQTSLFTVTPEGASYAVDSYILPVGENTITASIRDSAGNYVSDTSTFRVGGGNILKAVPGSDVISGSAPLTVRFVPAGGEDLGTIHFYRWDFNGDGTVDQEDVIAQDHYHIYNDPGTYNATLEVENATGETDKSGITITVQPGQAETPDVVAYLTSVEKDTVGYLADAEGNVSLNGTNISTTVTEDTNISLFIRDAEGKTVRTLVNNAPRNAKDYQDYWDCKDDSGFVVNDGVYYAILQYAVNSEVKTYDLSNSTGGERDILSSTNSIRSNFAPYEDDLLPIEFNLPKASEVSIFFGPTKTGDAELRIRTLVNRQAFPAGSHTVYWDGLDENGFMARAPLGSEMVPAGYRYDLSGNAIYVTGGRPVITNMSSEPNYFNPLSNTCSDNGNSVVVTYTVSEDVKVVELRVTRLLTNETVRILQQADVKSGENHILWLGKNNSSKYVEAGDYQFVITATDREGNTSLLYAVNLVKVRY